LVVSNLDTVYFRHITMSTYG